jgi:hypothetical protein
MIGSPKTKVVWSIDKANLKSLATAGEELFQINLSIVMKSMEKINLTTQILMLLKKKSCNFPTKEGVELPRLEIKAISREERWAQWMD